MEFATVAMRCSKTGARFHVLFSRDDPRRKFRIADAVMKQPLGPVRTEAGRTYTLQTTTRAADSFDWAGFFCPGCGHGRDGCGTYLRCGKCQAYICGGTIRTLPSGVQTYQCYVECGEGGPLGGGKPMATLDAAGPVEIGGRFKPAAVRLLRGRS